MSAYEGGGGERKRRRRANQNTGKGGERNAYTPSPSFDVGAASLLLLLLLLPFLSSSLGRDLVASLLDPPHTLGLTSSPFLLLPSRVGGAAASSTATSVGRDSMRRAAAAAADEGGPWLRGCLRSSVHSVQVAEQRRIKSDRERQSL